MTTDQSGMSRVTSAVWIALFCGGLISALSFGVRSSFGLYLAPISAELGWGREVFALSMALQNLIWGVTSPIAGALADRYGPFRVIVGGAIIYIAGLLVMSMGQTPSEFHFGTGLLIGAALAGTSFGIVFGAVGRMVPDERRSWALGIVSASASLGQFGITPIGQAFLDAFGWSDALWYMSAIALLMIPLAFAFRSVNPEGTGVGNAESDQTMRQAIAEAFGNSSYWYLTLGFFVCGFHVAFIAVHLPAYVVDLGLSAEVGAWAIALVGLFNVIGSYSAGVLGGKHSKKMLLSWLYFARSIVIAIFIFSPPSTALVLVFAVAMGLLWLSTVPLTSGLVAQMFGMRYMTTLYGVVFLSHQIGSFLGVWLGGRFYDLTGSYDIIWWAGIALGIFSGIVHLPIKEEAVERQAA